MFNNQILAGAAGQGGSFYDYSIDQSLRFEDGSSPALSKAYSTAQTNTKIITASVWVKRASLGIRTTIMFAKSGSSGWFIFNTDDKLYWNPYNTGYNAFKSTRVFRDTSTWYHIVATADSDTQSGANIYNVYVNGEQLTNSDGSSHVPDDTATKFLANGLSTYIGDDTDGAYHFDGYLAEMHVIDGSVVAHTEFGETKNGVWVPKAYSGSYGNNGFYLSFADSSSLGDDLSGNTNDFTASNLAASDVVLDSPTNNFATWNSLQPQGAAQGTNTLSEGNLKAGNSANKYGQSMGNMSVLSGKWYTETYVSDTGYPSWHIGWTYGSRFEAFDGGTNSDEFFAGFGYFTGSNVYFSSFGTGYAALQRAYSGIHTAGDAPTTGDVIGCAADFDNGKFWWSINGEWLDAGSGAGDPANGSNAAQTYTVATYADKYKSPFVLNYNGSFILNAGQDSTFAGAITAGGNSDENGNGDFKYSVPSGFLALCSANLPEPTIGPNSGVGEQSDDYFNTVLYTGNASTNAITGVGFSPNFVWIKNRSATQAHNVFDTVRGAGKLLYPNLTNAEYTSSTHLNSFDSDGFTVGSATSANGSGNSIVAWNWKAGGTAASNTSGSITSSVSANQDAGFSIVSYTGTGANATVGHGLSSAPEMYIVKGRAASNWSVYHSGTASDAETDYLILNSTAAAADLNTYWNDTAPTSSVFSLGTDSNVNGNTSTYIAYCFNSVEGFSKVGSYVGNGSTDGMFVYTGFRPAWVMVKCSSSSQGGNADWRINDDRRLGYNPESREIYANLSLGEASGNPIDILSNGFKIRNSSSGYNGSGATYIYLAFAEAPFKYANAR